MAIKSRGIPSQDAVYLPAIDSQVIKKRGGYEKSRWELEHVLDHVFPSEFQETYNHVAYHLMKEVLEKGSLSGEDLSNFIKERGFSKSTVYNRVIPKLRRVGLIKRQRFGKTIHIEPSNSFSKYVGKIASEWDSIFTTSKRKRSLSSE